MQPEIRPPRLRPFRELAGLVRGAVSLPRLALDAPRVPTVSAPVIVLPGYLAGDGSTLALRAYLTRCGHRVAGWQQGRNRGDVRRLVPRIIDEVTRRYEAGGQRVHLVGWSLGGVIARETAREIPNAVAQVITMGSPVIGGPKYTVVARAPRRSGMSLDEIERAFAKRNEVPIKVPVTALYSKRDGIVAWQACIDPNPDNDVEHLEFNVTHVEFPWNATVLKQIAARIDAVAADGRR